jgi:hypothetical protein
MVLYDISYSENWTLYGLFAVAEASKPQNYC